MFSVLHLQAFTVNAVHPVIYFVCDPAVSFRGFINEAADIRSVNQFLLESLGQSQP